MTHEEIKKKYFPLLQFRTIMSLTVDDAVSLIEAALTDFQRDLLPTDIELKQVLTGRNDAARRALADAGVTTLKQVYGMGKQNVLRIKHVGTRAYHILTLEMEKRNYNMDIFKGPISF